MSNLSKHFDLAELLVSEAAVRNDIDMTPTASVLDNLRNLASEVLEPIREQVMGPLVITSGYRPKALNDLIGGSKDSDHLTGCAADVHAPGMSLYDLSKIVDRLKMQIPLKQAILEFNQWLHVSIQSQGEAPRREFLTASRDNGRTVYTSGIQSA